jgi:hypothetical protein
MYFSDIWGRMLKFLLFFIPIHLWLYEQRLRNTNAPVSELNSVQNNSAAIELWHRTIYRNVECFLAWLDWPLLERMIPTLARSSETLSTKVCSSTDINSFVICGWDMHCRMCPAQVFTSRWLSGHCSQYRVSKSGIRNHLSITEFM